MAQSTFSAVVETDGTNYRAYRGSGTYISVGTNFATVLNAAFTDVNGRGGGTIFLNSGTYTVTASSPILPLAGCTLLGEPCGRQNGTTALYAGSYIKGPAGSMGGPIINGTDVKSFQMDGIGVDANSQATYCVVFSGYGSGARNCSFVKGTTAAVRFTDGASNTQDAYTDMFFGPNNWVNQGGTATKGVVCETSGAGTARPTDGEIFGNNRIWGARSGGIYVSVGAWNVFGNRIVSDASATLGAYMSSGHGSFTHNTVDSIGNGHFLEVDGSSFEVSSNRYLLAGSGSGHSIMYVTSGSDLVFDRNFVDGNAGQTYTYTLEFAADPTTSRMISVSKMYTRQTAPVTAQSNFTTTATGYVYDTATIQHHA